MGLSSIGEPQRGKTMVGQQTEKQCPEDHCNLICTVGCRNEWSYSHIVQNDLSNDTEDFRGWMLLNRNKQNNVKKK